MFDFFDEDFPLSKKQEEALRKLAEEADKVNDDGSEDIVIEEPKIDLSNVTVEEPDDEDFSFAEKYREALNADLPEDDEETEVEPEPENEPENIDNNENSDNNDNNDNEAMGEKLDDLVYHDEPEPEAEAESEAEVDLNNNEEKEPEAAEEIEDESAVERAFTEISENAEEADGEPSEEGNSEDIWKEIAEAKDGEESAGGYDEWSDFAPPAADPKIIDELEAHLHAELKSLGEKLDNMERVIDEMEDGEVPEGFEYEYNADYFSEEDTPAYKHPELYARSREEDDDFWQAPIKPAEPEPEPEPVAVAVEEAVSEAAEEVSDDNYHETAEEVAEVSDDNVPEAAEEVAEVDDDYLPETADDEIETVSEDYDNDSEPAADEIGAEDSDVDDVYEEPEPDGYEDEEEIEPEDEENEPEEESAPKIEMTSWSDNKKSAGKRLPVRTAERNLPPVNVKPGAVIALAAAAAFTLSLVKKKKRDK